MAHAVSQQVTALVGAKVVRKIRILQAYPSVSTKKYALHMPHSSRKKPHPLCRVRAPVARE